MQFGPPKIITTNLTSYLDAANPSSYPGSGTTWTDLSGNNNNFILTNEKLLPLPLKSVQVVPLPG